MVDSFIAIFCLAAAVIYAGILGDVFTPLWAQAGLPVVSRTALTSGIAATLLLPLSLIQNLSALAFTSILGFGAILYTVFFITVRALDGSYRLGSGAFVTDGVLELLPRFERESLWKVNFASLVLMSNLGLAYVAHYNAPTFYRDLKETSVPRFRKMVSVAFAVLIGLYTLTMCAGYSTFGDVCQGNILLNYHPSDVLALLGRLATGFSILFGFPLVMTGCREALIGAASSLGYPQVGQHHFALVASLITFVTAIACTVQDVSLVVGLTGATLGSFIVYIAPALLYERAVKLSKGEHSPEYRSARKVLLLVPFGLLVAGLGCYMTLQE